MNMEHVLKATIPTGVLLKYLFAGIISGISTPMRTPNRGFT